MPLEVQILHTRRRHFGRHAGIQQFIAHLDPARVHARVRSVADGDDDLAHRFPFRHQRVRTALKRLVQRRGQAWYQLSDFAAEQSVLRSMMKQRIDLVHFVDGEHTAQFLPAIGRTLRHRARTIATYHQPPSILPEVVVPSVVRQLDHVTLVSSSQLEYFEPILPRHRLSVILHGVDIDFFEPDAGRTLGTRFRCLTVGSYLRDWTLLAAIARTLASRGDVELHIVSANMPAFDALPNVVVHRGMDDDTLRELYRQSDLLVLPLIDATANNTLLEAMASGLPIVTSDLPSLHEYAAAEAAIFLPTCVEAFVDAVEALADNAARRVTMGRAARARAEELAWPRIASDYATLYETLARTGPQ